MSIDASIEVAIKEKFFQNLGQKLGQSQITGDWEHIFFSVYQLWCCSYAKVAIHASIYGICCFNYTIILQGLLS
jgi:hypothetical protein